MDAENERLFKLRTDLGNQSLEACRATDINNIRIKTLKERLFGQEG